MPAFFALSVVFGRRSLQLNLRSSFSADDDNLITQHVLDGLVVSPTALFAMSARFFNQDPALKDYPKKKTPKQKSSSKPNVADPGDLPVDNKKITLYARADHKFNPKSATKSKVHQKRLQHVKKKKQFAAVKSVHSEVLLTEESGYLEADVNEETYQITQKELKDAVDITSASKCFDLTLDYGPYRLDYFPNGRSLLFGGRRGHVAVFDWLTKKLKCEFNVQESVHDVKFLHIPGMFAVSQKDWVHIYDDQGIEMHCLKPMFRSKFLDFLPYHFLLMSGAENGYLTWTDVSIGQTVASYLMNHANNKICTMCQNKTNAIMHTGHSNGTVALWSPNEKKPLVKMLAHQSSVRGMTISSDGNYMASTSIDRAITLTDLRMYKEVFQFRHFTVPTHVDFSARNMLAVSLGDVVEVYKDFTRVPPQKPYMRHREPSIIHDISFVNYEDVLGVGHQKGLSSILIPGSGEANFDAFESNPFMTSSQRKEMEVKALLDKIPANLITLDSRELAKVDVEGLKREQEERDRRLLIKNRKVALKNKTSVKKVKKTVIQEGLRTEATRRRVKELKKVQERQAREGGQDDEVAKTQTQVPITKDVYSRFKSK